MILGNHYLSMAGIIPNFLSVTIKGLGSIRAEIAGIQSSRSKPETVQGVSILDDVIQKNAALLFRQCCLAQGVIPVVKCHDQINSVIKGQRMCLTIVSVVICCPLAMTHIQPVILAAGVMENRGGTQCLPIFLG